MRQFFEKRADFGKIVPEYPHITPIYIICIHEKIEKSCLQIELNGGTINVDKLVNLGEGKLAVKSEPKEIGSFLAAFLFGGRHEGMGNRIKKGTLGRV